MNSPYDVILGQLKLKSRGPHPLQRARAHAAHAGRTHVGYENEIVPLDDEVRRTLSADEIGSWWSPVTNSIQNALSAVNELNSLYLTLDSEIKRNVSRVPFLTAWNSVNMAWGLYYQTHNTALTVTVTGPDTVLGEVAKFREHLKNQRDAYNLEVPTYPSAIKTIPDFKPPPPAPDPNAPAANTFSTSTIILFTIGGLALLGVLGTMTYFWLRQTHRNIESGKHMLPGLMARGGNAHGGSHAAQLVEHTSLDPAHGAHAAGGSGHYESF